MKALFISSFFVHLVFMNVTLGGALLAVWYRTSERAGSLEHELARRLSRLLPATMAATLITGLVPWLTLQDYQDDLGYTSYVLGGLPWFSITLLLLAAYYGLYAFQDRKSAGWAIASALALGAVAMLFARYHAEPTPSLLEQVTYPAVGLAGALLPRFAHFLAGALAVACGFVVLLGVLERNDPSPFSQFAIVSGARGYILFTLIQYLVGLSYLFALPLPTIAHFLGGNWMGTALLGTALAVSLTSLLYMHRAATVVENRVPPALKGLGGLAVTVLLMILIRDRL
jgi:cytochrome c